MAETVVKTRMMVRPSSVPPPWGEAVPAPRNTLTSKLFWELMDRWRAADETALRLLGHEGGLTLQGKRLRFALTPEEAHRLTSLLAIDRLLTELFGEAAPWVKRAHRSALFNGKTPLDFMIQEGQRGVDRARHFLETEVFKKSL